MRSLQLLIFILVVIALMTMVLLEPSPSSPRHTAALAALARGQAQASRSADHTCVICARLPVSQLPVSTHEEGAAPAMNQRKLGYQEEPTNEVLLGYCEVGTVVSVPVGRGTGDSSLGSLVALPTVPRSGSGFVRSLVERATGSLTGSAFAEYSDWVAERGVYLQRNASCGSHLDRMQGTKPSQVPLDRLVRPCDHPSQSRVRRPEASDPILVKGHAPFLEHWELDAFGPERFAAVVLLVRNPFDMYAAMSGSNQLPVGSNFRQFMARWAAHCTYWLAGSATEVPLYVAHYEAFVADPQSALTRLLTFLGPLGFGWSPTRVNHALATAPRPTQHAERPVACRPLNATLVRASLGLNVQQPITLGDVRQTIDTYGRLLQRLGYTVEIQQGRRGVEEM